MKKVLVLTLLSLSTLTHAGVIKSKCTGSLLAVQNTGTKYTIDANWTVANDGSTITVSEGHVKMTGTFHGGVAEVASEANSERMKLLELDEKHVQVKGMTLNETGNVVSNVTGVLTCR